MCRRNFPANFCLVFVSFSLQQDVKRKGGKQTIALSAPERLIHAVKGCLSHVSLAQTLVFHYRDGKRIKATSHFCGEHSTGGRFNIFLDQFPWVWELEDSKCLEDTSLGFGPRVVCLVCLCLWCCPHGNFYGAAEGWIPEGSSSFLKFLSTLDSEHPPWSSWALFLSFVPTVSVQTQGSNSLPTSQEFLHLYFTTYTKGSYALFFPSWPKMDPEPKAQMTEMG